MLPALIFIIIMIVILIYESRKTKPKSRQYYVFLRPNGRYIVATTQNPGERDSVFLRLRYDNYITETFASSASEFTTLRNAKIFWQLYLDQDPRQFIPVP